MPLTRKKVARGSKAKAAARAKAEKTAVEVKQEEEVTDDVQGESQEDKIAGVVVELEVDDAKETEENVEEVVGDIEGDVEGDMEGDVEGDVEGEGFLQGDGDEIIDEQEGGEEELEDDGQDMETAEDGDTVTDDKDVDDEIQEINGADGDDKEDITITISGDETDEKMEEDKNAEGQASDEMEAATDSKTNEASTEDKEMKTEKSDYKNKEGIKKEVNTEENVKKENETVEKIDNEADMVIKNEDDNQDKTVNKVDIVQVKDEDEGSGKTEKDKVEKSGKTEEKNEREIKQAEDANKAQKTHEKTDEVENAEDGDQEIMEEENVEEGADDQDKELDENADVDGKDEHDDDDDEHPDIDTSDLIDSLPQSDWDIINEKFKNPPFPESLSKLQKLTVTIGPIQQGDLLSLKLHEVLRMIRDFEITFQGKEKPPQRGRKVFEKLGYVKTQFKIETPAYLVKMATLLGNLNIRGRDMSVKFPEVFNTAVKDAKDYLNENGAAIKKNRKDKSDYITNLKKRKIIVKNIPENTTEETMKALFPECLTVVFRADEDDKKNKKNTCSAILTFEDEKSCLECYDNSKDVEIGDSKVVMRLLHDPTKFRRTHRGSGRGGFRGRGGFGRGMGSSFRGMRSPPGGRGMSSIGTRPPVVTKPKPAPVINKEKGQFDLPPRKRTLSSTSSKQDTGKSPSSDRRSANRRSLNSDMGPPKSKRPALKSPQRGGGQFKEATPKERRPKAVPRKSGTGGDVCFKCGERGHFARDCTAQGRPMQQNVSPRNSSQFQQGNMQGGNMMRNNQLGQMQQQQQFQQQNFQMPSQMPGLMQAQMPGSMQGQSNQGMNQEDPMAMMMYLKDTIAKMEEKISQRSNDGLRGNQYGGMGGSSRDNFSDYSPPMNRKRQGDTGGMMYGNQNVKRNRQDDFSMRGQDSRFQGMSPTSQGFQGGNNFNNNRDRGQRFGSGGGRYGGGNW